MFGPEPVFKLFLCAFTSVIFANNRPVLDLNRKIILRSMVKMDWAEQAIEGNNVKSFQNKGCYRKPALSERGDRIVIVFFKEPFRACSTYRAPSAALFPAVRRNQSFP